MSSFAEFYTPPRPNMHHFSGAGQNPQWIACSNGNHPNNSIECGYGSDGVTKLYVARARQGGALCPGKLHPKYKTCYVPQAGKEHSVSNYEVLVAPPGTLTWVNSSHGVLVPNAVVGGKSETGETLYIGRCHHAGLLTCGKIHPSHSACYVPYNGKEFGYSNYQVLVRTR